MNHPKKAAAAVRQKIVECLQAERYRIHSDGQRYLDLKDLRAEHIIEDLIDHLQRFHIFHLPPADK